MNSQFASRSWHSSTFHLPLAGSRLPDVTHLFFISCHCPPHPPSALPSHTLGQLLHLIFPFPLLKLSNLRFLLEFSWTQLFSYFPFPHNNWYLCALNSGRPIFPLYFPPSFPPHHTSPFLTCSPPLEAVCCVDCPFKTLVLVTLPESVL